MPTDTMPVYCDTCALDNGLTPGMIKSRAICSVCEEEKDCAIPIAVTHRTTSFRQPGTEDGPLAPTVRAAQTPRDEEGHFACPHCEAEIDQLQYSCSQVQYGHADLVRIRPGILSRPADGVRNMVISTENFETDDTGDESDYIFLCPECRDDLRESDVIWMPHTEEAESSDLDTEPAVDSDEPMSLNE